jgi:hypothetical protein
MIAVVAGNVYGNIPIWMNTAQILEG